MGNTNTNSALNKSRESVNEKTLRYNMLGKTNRIIWEAKRSYRAY